MALAKIEVETRMYGFSKTEAKPREKKILCSESNIAIKS